jgi:hypothetical protein
MPGLVTAWFTGLTGLCYSCWTELPLLQFFTFEMPCVCTAGRGRGRAEGSALQQGPPAPPQGAPAGEEAAAGRGKGGPGGLRVMEA